MGGLGYGTKGGYQGGAGTGEEGENDGEASERLSQQ